MSRPQEPNPLYVFISDFDNCLTRIIEANGFGKFGISIEIAGNKKGEKKFALILEGQPSSRYVFNIEHFNQFSELIKDWKSKGNSENP
jgi:hypothetical protein